MWECWKQGGSVQMKLSYLNGITHRYNGFWPKLVAYGQRSDAVPDGPDTGRARGSIVCDRYRHIDRRTFQTPRPLNLYF